MKKILAVTACPTGIAHTYMAAEALQEAAKNKNVEIKVETRGAVGIENELTPEEINEAHAIILAVDVDAEDDRFAGKNVIKVGVAEGIKDPNGLIEKALEMQPKESNYQERVETIKAERSSERAGFYKHLMNGVSNMLPLVVAGGLLIALSFIFGIKSADPNDPTFNPIAKALMDIGGGSAFALMVPVLAGYIAFSIAGKPGLAPGLIGGMLASKLGAGFLGGIIAGFLAGYVAKWLRDHIKLSKNFAGLVPILIIPLFSTAIVGLLMVFVIGTPVKAIMDTLTVWLTGMSSTNAVILGLILGAMMAFDMGGPVNKAAYTFAVGLLGSNVYAPMAAVMAAGMIPPLGLWLATLIAPKNSL
ncbi:fructose-specific PTS transporter subunit EIIC [Tepidibacillus marianensis]|uniref:PTS fructose transporter subunit IIC n=1 Tax=Tepidibacillus marianensis TaxID=3131995 RepID=UPI0030CFF297